MQYFGFRVIIKRIQAIKFLLRDPEVPKRKKALVIFGILYLFFPIDVIPIIVFPFGITDDIILWAFILWHLKDELDKYWYGEPKEDFSKKFRDKDIVEGVQFEVSEDDKEK
ncbi:MAG: DUF1232 domain-containing protein [Eubacteriales bacterium]|nr:DUF1232 domain-containing protein [Eubacteriales bacterium]